MRAISYNVKYVSLDFPRMGEGVNDNHFGERLFFRKYLEQVYYSDNNGNCAHQIQEAIVVIISCTYLTI